MMSKNDYLIINDYHIIEESYATLQIPKISTAGKDDDYRQHLQTVSISRSSCSSCAFSRHRGMCLTTKLKVWFKHEKLKKKQGQGIWQCHIRIHTVQCPFQKETVKQRLSQFIIANYQQSINFPGPYLILRARTLFKKLAGRGPTYSRVAQ